MELMENDKQLAKKFLTKLFKH